MSRDELYAQIWAKPMTKVAAEYGVTGTALKKTCNRHQIPTPPLGYWAKLQHGKTVKKPGLPKLEGSHLKTIRVAGNPALNLPEGVHSAREKVRKSLDEQMLPAPEAETSSATDGSQRPELKILAATCRAILKARPNAQGFHVVHGPGIVPLTIAPTSAERALGILHNLLTLAATLGYQPQGTEKGFALMVEDETIAFSLEERARNIPHEPTAAELKERDRRLQWGSTKLPWPKYDYLPSGRLAVVIDANFYSGLRRTYTEGKTRELKEMLPDVLAGFAEHAALAKERRLAQEERDRAFKEAEARRHRQEEFETREKRRMEFMETVHTQLAERIKLSAVLSHLETAAADVADRPPVMIAWLRRRIRQIDDLISPRFLDISSRAAKVNFEEPPPKKEPDDRYFGYLPPITLQFWSIDEEKGIATAATQAEWLDRTG